MSASSKKTDDTGEPHTDERSASVDPSEIAGFEALADAWWDADGPFRPLHRFNPVRVGFIRDRVCAHFDCQTAVREPLKGLSLLDIGTGGGLVAEPMARMGATVTGIDPSPKNIAVAQAHARQMELEITYRAETAEALAEEDADFDIVLALEVVEHVSDLGAFLDAAGELLRPGGLLITATLNRTARAYALAIIGAEYVLRWLPRGTHDWEKFVTPEELTTALTQTGLTVETVAGLSYNPLTASWRVSGDTAVNYAVVATRPRP
ncbi:MAG TPA: bifunctional 2-polyprenyl-6-hydroxyphenol methylase/3-demethylubiquinol 3-O-methyltransferase UbiG [Alphaproteobacteria bacterium]|nr:bifunctional 2-polyprenyl-6-hydroxyphenol methylase/3-demethylubiquinol 3-O-methyltransferase UbiG [Alphaproteobacteria bacterium]